MDIDDIAKAIFAALDYHGCFNDIDDELRAEILKEIGDILENCRY